MSKRINVNPDHYKVAGRERPGKGGIVERDKQKLALSGPKPTSRRRPAPASVPPDAAAASDSDGNSDARDAATKRALQRRSRNEE
jgi:hypothetical protein